jgi:hypothetical protein
MLNVVGSLALALSLVAIARPAAAEAPEFASGLQSPEQRSLRYSAYALPKGMWAFDLGVLGVTGEELYGSLGIKYGFGAGLQLELNLAHYAVGLFNIGARWNFLEIPHFALAATVDFTYGHGAWIWIVAPLVRDVLQETDLIAVPIGVTASSALLSWLELDLGLSYRYATVWGSLGDGPSLYADAQLGAQQFIVHPGVRLFASDATAFEFSVDLPVYTWVPYEGTLTAELRDRGYERSGSGGATLALSETWKLEAAVRSRLTPWFFCTLRLHYGKSNKYLYSTTVTPSMSFEFRL